MTELPLDRDVVDLHEPDDENVVDEAAQEASSSLIFDISSYGADYTVDSVVKRMRSGAFYVPPFQRSYVWTLRRASRFIESLLLGLPVPGVFVYKEDGTNKHLIVDGQQRLATLRMFYDGFFDEKRFRLVEVSDQWEGKTYDELSDPDKQKLDDSIIHTTIFKQDAPAESNLSIYHVFERLNSGGMSLQPQEIRNCVNHGSFAALLAELNENPDWRAIYGPPNKRMKDQELILRFFAFLNDLPSYERPMADFLTKYMEDNRELQKQGAAEFRRVFEEMVSLAKEALGAQAFRPQKVLNTAVFDSVAYGLAKRAAREPKPDLEKIRAAYHVLLDNPGFQAAYTRATADEESVRTRMRLAEEAFAAT